MAIEKMKRFQLYIFDKDRKPLLKRLQQFQNVHFVDVRRNIEDDTRKAPEVNDEILFNQETISKVEWMIHFLEPLEEKKGMLQDLKEGVPSYSLSQMNEIQQQYNWNPLYEELSASNERTEQAKAKIAQDKAEISERKPLADVNVPMENLNHPGRITTQWGVISLQMKEEFENALKDENYLVVETLAEHGRDQYVQVAYLTEDKERMEELLRREGFQPLTYSGKGTVQNQIRGFETSIHENGKVLEREEAFRKERVPELKKLRVLYEALENERLRLEAQSNFGVTTYTTEIEGYIPASEEAHFTRAIEEVAGDSFAIDLVDADRNSPEVPIRLKNNKVVKAFESVTNMYAMPHYNEIDPTPLLMPFYWFFFGMMGADIGYGLILLIGTALALKFFNLRPAMRSFVQFFFYLSFAVIFWGVIYGSFLGGLIPLPFLIDMNSDFMLMLILSVAFGAVHLFFGMAVKAYMSIRDGNFMDAVYDVFLWYLALVGAIVWLMSSFLPGIPAIVGTIAKYAMIIGMVGIILFGARNSESIMGRLVGGLYELYGISSYIGDFVSYSRLMALGLSSGFIGVAVNMIVSMLFDAGIIGYIFGFVVFIGFHLFNLFLTMLSGYVHTARLTYVEFFGKFYEGGGVRFKPFISEPKYIDITPQEGTKL